MRDYERLETMPHLAAPHAHVVGLALVHAAVEDATVGGHGDRVHHHLQRTCVCVCVCVCARARVHARARACERMRGVCTCKRVHAVSLGHTGPTHINTCAHTHTHTHTHTWKPTGGRAPVPTTMSLCVCVCVCVSAWTCQWRSHTPCCLCTTARRTCTEGPRAE